MKEMEEAECGHCVYIVSGKELFVGEKEPHLFNNKKWSALQKEMVMLPAVESYSPLATYVINACKKMGCDDQVTKFKIKLGALKNVVVP